MLDLGFHNMDCMEGMKRFPDKYFGLAIVDPPYGIGYNRTGTTYANKIGGKDFYSNDIFTSKKWDNKQPNKLYFRELFRVSENQIIFGGNYFKLPISRGWIFWDKKLANANNNYGAGELAWTSFDMVIKKFTYDWIGLGYLNSTEKGSRIHPTQKPVTLYRWLLHNYAKPGQIILDTHVGSASSLIACEQMGFKYVGFELDKEYYEAASKRIENEREKLKQMNLVLL